MQNEQRPRPVSNELAMVLGQLMMNSFGSSTLMREILESICFGNDWYGVTFDFDEYVKVQEKVDKTWKNKKEWTKKSILSTSRMGIFSSDASFLYYHVLTQNLKLLFESLARGTLTET